MIRPYLITECGYSPQEVAISLKDWEIVPILDGETQIGEAMINGNEIHIAFAKVHRGCMKRRVIHAFLSKHLGERKFLVTKTTIGAPTEDFVSRIGFSKTNTDKHFNYWWLDKLPFSKG